jgi:hypothetical protein
VKTQIGLVLAIIALSQGGCRNITQAIPAQEKHAEVRPVFWELQPADKRQISEGLSVCLTAINSNSGQRDKLSANGWQKRPIPSWAVTKEAIKGTTEVFSHDGTPILIALKSMEKKNDIDHCSVLAAASEAVIESSVETVDGSFSKNMKMMPHGPWWTAGGVRIDNDYANLHVFEPQVFDPEDFRTSTISDIRVYKCKEHCE